MKKCVFALFVGLIVILSLMAPVLATEQDESLASRPRVVDQAYLLDAAERVYLIQLLDEISLRHGMDVLLVTIKDLDGYTAWNYAKKFCRNHLFGAGEHDDGILVLVSEGSMWIFTVGSGGNRFTDSAQEYITKGMDKSMKKEDYLQAFNQYADLCDTVLSNSGAGEPFDERNLPKEPFQVILFLCLSLPVGIIAGIAVVRKNINQLRSGEFHYDAAAYQKSPEVMITEDKETYLYSTTEKRLKT